MCFKPKACNFIKNESPAHALLPEFCETLKNIFFTEHLQTTASFPMENQLFIFLCFLCLFALNQMFWLKTLKYVLPCCIIFWCNFLMEFGSDFIKIHLTKTVYKTSIVWKHALNFYMFFKNKIIYKEMCGAVKK